MTNKKERLFKPKSLQASTGGVNPKMLIFDEVFDIINKRLNSDGVKDMLLFYRKILGGLN